MTGRQFNTGESQPPQGGEGLDRISIAEVLSLPDDQRQLIVWMMRQGTVSLAAISDHLQQSDEVTQAILQDLIQREYVEAVSEESWPETEPAYRVNVGFSRRSRQFAETVLQEMPSNQPLSVILSSAGEDLVTPGSMFTLSVTIRNKGNQSAVIDVYIDESSPPLQQWCHSTQERLALGSNQVGEVVFHIHVPPNALPGSYNYWVVVEAHQHYPDMPPLQYPHQLQVLPPVQATVRVNDPTFALQPKTTSAKPALLQPGGALQVQVIVYNRADRVDRFRLICSDLPERWFSLNYPQGVQEPGLAIEDECLDLNPGAQGIILLMITPPLDAIAGTYTPTLRLRSENRPELALLDLLYLEVQPIYQLDVSFRTLISRIRTKPALFTIQAANRGNTNRTLLLHIVSLDGGDLCTYTLDPPRLELLPKQTLTSRLWIEPKKSWKRPLLGGGRILNFAVEAEDVDQVPLPEIPMQGAIVWEARPWWQILPLILLALGTLVGLVLLVWWILLRPPAAPRIVRFSPEDTRYSALDEDAVRLSFQVSYPDQVQALEIVGQSPDNKVISGPLIYSLSEGLPRALQPFCTLQRRLLSCRNLVTDARRAGDYIFTLTLIPETQRGAVRDSLTTPLVTILPIPLPQITAFNSTQPIYQAGPPLPVVTNLANGQRAVLPPNPAEDPNRVRLNWAIAHPEQLQALQLVGRDAEGKVVVPAVQFSFEQGLPEALIPWCQVQTQLVCQDVPTEARQAGDYVFELTAIPIQEAPETPITVKTDPIKIQPRPPQILTFLVNGAPAQAKYAIPVEPDRPTPEFVLGWQIEPAAGVKAELMPAPGTVPLSGSLALPISPQPTSTVITLSVTNVAGEQVTRSLTLETYDPTPERPDTIVVNTGEEAAGGAGAAAGGAGAAGSGAGAAGGAGGAGTRPLDVPIPSRPGTVSPSELPPQFE